jgi:hypothetical protein
MDRCFDYENKGLPMPDTAQYNHSKSMKAPFHQFYCIKFNSKTTADGGNQQRNPTFLVGLIVWKWTGLQSPNQ